MKFDRNQVAFDRINLTAFALPTTVPVCFVNCPSVTSIDNYTCGKRRRLSPCQQGNSQALKSAFSCGPYNNNKRARPDPGQPVQRQGFEEEEIHDSDREKLTRSQ